MESVLDTHEATVVSADGTKIWAAHAGKLSTEAPTLILIPGFSCSSLFFVKQFQDEELLAKLSLITYEPRGQGRSGSPADESLMSSKKVAEDFDAVCENFSATNVYVAGWSAGGVIPCDVFEHLSPDYIAGVIYLNGSPYRASYPPMKHPSGATALGPLGQSPQDADVVAKAVSSLIDYCVYAPNRAAMGYTLRSALAGAAALQPSRNRLFTQLGHKQDPTALLARAKSLETLLIVGVHDEMTIPDMLEAKLASEFPLLQVKRVEEAGHAVFLGKAQRGKRSPHCIY